MEQNKSVKKYPNTPKHRARRERTLARLLETKFTPKNGRTEKAWRANMDKQIAILKQRLK